MGEDTYEPGDEDTRQSRELADAVWALGRFERLWTAFINHPAEDGVGRRSAARAAFLAKGDVDALVARVFVSAGGTPRSEHGDAPRPGISLRSPLGQEAWSHLDH